MVRGIRYQRDTQSTFHVTVPIEQDISVSRGVITRFCAAIVQYDDATEKQSACYETNFDDDLFCVDEDDLETADGDDLYTFMFTGLSKLLPIVKKCCYDWQYL